MNDGRFTLNKDATTASYCEHADGILVTCRRAADSPTSDQVLVLVKKGDYTLTQTTTWDTMGMRGTCSPGFKLTSSRRRTDRSRFIRRFFGPNDGSVFAHPVGVVVVGHRGRSSRAAKFVRAKLVAKPGTVPQTATTRRGLDTTAGSAAQLDRVATEFDEIDAQSDGMEELLSIGWALQMNNLKINASETAPQIVHKALQTIGVLGYKNDSTFSVGRHYRDSLSAALMISNDRILSKSASMLLVFKDE